MDYLPLIKWLISTLVIGGALWKGIDSIAKALKARAEAVNMAQRLDLDTVQANYQNALQLIKEQAERIDALHNDITRVESRWETNEMKYLERIRWLESEIKRIKAEHKAEYKTLEEIYHRLECDHEKALERIEKLEKGDTGPLKGK